MSNTFKLIGYLSILVLAGILTLIILLLPAETSFPLFLIICAVSLVIGLIAPVVEPRIRRFTHPIVRYLAASSTLNNILKLFALVVKPLEGPVDAISKL